MAGASIRTTEKKQVIDLATIIGLVVAFCLVFIAHIRIIRCMYTKKEIDESFEVF